VISGSEICTHRPSLSFVVNEISRNKVVAGRCGWICLLIRSFLLVEYSFTLNYCVVRFDMIWFVDWLLICFWYCYVFYWNIILVIVFLWFNFLYDRLFVPWGVDWFNKIRKYTHHKTIHDKNHSYMFRHRIAIFRRTTNTNGFCVRRPPEDGTLVPKHVGVILIMNCVLWCVFYCILLREFLGQYIELQTRIS